MKRGVNILLPLLLSLLLLVQVKAYETHYASSQGEIQQTEKTENSADYPSSRGILFSSESQAESGIQSFNRLSELSSVEESKDKEVFANREYVNKQFAHHYECYSDNLNLQQYFRLILFPFHSFL